jgi:putative ATP-dependent endonuclease of OLD family
MGVRSVAVLSTYKSYIEIEKLKFDSVNDVVYNLLLIEEPETHVHPQAQKHIYSKISELPAQVITTTHSPYIIYKSNLADILIANMDNAETKTDNIDLSTLNEEEIIAINKFVLLTKGDILFSNLVVLCEGITEELLLPEFINDLVGKPTDQLGINVVGVSGQNYKPFIQVLSSLSIPWILLSDGESLVVNQMKNTVKQVLNIDDNHFNAMSNIFVLPEDHDIEYYLYSNYKNDIHQVLYELLGEEEYNYQKESLNGNIRKKKYLAKFNNVLIRDYDNEPQNTEVLDILYSNKGQFGKEIARKILSLENPRRVPSIIGDICNEIKSIMGMGED